MVRGLPHQTRSIFILPEIFRGSAAGAGAAPPLIRLIRRDLAHILTGCCEDRLDDIVIARATAQVPFEVVAYLGLCWRRVVLEQRRRRHHHARRAEPALQPVMVLERGLNGMQRAVGLGHPLDGLHLHTLGLGGEHGAGLHGAALHMHHAGPALACVTANMRARQAQVLSQEIDKKRAALDLARRWLAVHGQLDLWHWLLPVRLYLSPSQTVVGSA